MTYYIPKSQTVTLASGRKEKLVRGVGEISDELAHSAQANELGIKPVEEMTDAERRLLWRPGRAAGPTPAG